MEKNAFSLAIRAVCLVCFASTAWVHAAVNIHGSPAYKLATLDPAKAIPNLIYTHGDPTDQEQYTLELVNRVRAKPADEARLIAASSDSRILRGLQTYNIDTNQLINTFSSYRAKPPLAFNAKLISSARIHSQDMAQHDFQDHTGTDGSTLSDRLKRAGYGYVIGGENIFAYAYSPWYAQVAFLVDWGVPDLGHRINLLDLDQYTHFREIGIGIVAENDANTTVGPLIMTQDFGLIDASIVYITGVVYRDINANHAYDLGEGLTGVQITPSHGDYYANTSNSGGYAIPVAIGSGKYTVRATRSDLPEITADVYIEQANVKLDFPLGDPAFATIAGTIYDSGTGLAMAGVAVKLSPVNVTATTDAEGGFMFSDLPAASYKMSSSLDGYTFEPNDITITLSSGQDFRLNVFATSNETVANMPPQSQNTSASNSTPSLTTNPLNLSCPITAAGLMVVLTMAFGVLQPRRK